MENHYQTPYLTTATTAPLHLLETKLLSHQNEIEDWLAAQWKLTPPPVYGSVDLRNAGFKLAPIDMNLFPAGFNNLNIAFLPLSIEAAKLAIHNVLPQASRVLIVPESHTRNLFYWDNINTLLSILTQAGFTVRIGSLLPDATDVVLNSGQIVKVEPLVRMDNHVGVKDFIPEIILLNNDLSDAIPDILQNLKQPIVPPAELGWNQRLKSGYKVYKMKN